MASPVRFKGSGYALECKVVDVGKNWESVKAIETQYSNRCGVHSVNNMFQKKVIKACPKDENLYMDQVAKYIKSVSPDLFIYTCQEEWLHDPAMSTAQILSLIHI